MAKELRDGELDKIVKTTTDKLVCVDFGNPTCPPCIRAKPIWNSMASKYPTCAFYSVECQSCPGTASDYQIHATPTFVFILRGREVGRVQGFDQNQIVSIIEKYKPAGTFSGKGHTLGDSPAPNQDDYLARVLAQAQEAAMARNKPKQQAPEQSCCEGGICKIPPKNNKHDEELKQMLKEMDFPDYICDAAIKGTNHGSIDDCVAWIAENQDEVERLQSVNKVQQDSVPVKGDAPATPAPAETPAPAPEPISQPEEKIVLSAAGESMKNDLVDMGIEEDLAIKAIDYCDAESIDKALDYIYKVQNGEQIPPKKKQMTQEQAKAFVEQMRLKAKAAEEAKNTPEARAKAEIERRKQLKEDAERHEIMEQQKREKERRQIEQQRIQDKLELERVKARIRAQRAEQAGNTQQQATVQPVQQTHVSTKAPATEATIQFVLPDNTKKVIKFPLDATISDVEKKVKSEIPQLASRIIQFETVIPRILIPKSDYGKTLTDLHLTPRSQLCVKY
ncbi:Thioredoxin family protein [Trichomonas vaginalis G3]|uniref:Thioredoxin family protein n=1 Tax=Trichomonas vaginalis (strain ATCC PRA-98 / G3) TaxID=412133 RepID=A2G881_TRIV3|nr:thioredoxin-like protein 1 family [Trichomonas vaginalis G3]EAX86637.1 Thioredoxin family protein [Trichomonas vaginalis G3]KAI5550261.1 thioredoxin-like protein 1 family [Trichomonas vaginalis G3]|eukprot:XP_001299567.1 Thioredoxin family protein [Trichomonas vaginalis G3]